MIEIKHRDTGEVIATVHAADLIGVDFREVDLAGANFAKADLTGANLFEADLRGANLREANLREASLHGADLSQADLTKADLTRASLFRADFRGSNLAEANLAEIRADVFAVLSLARNEIAGLRFAVVEGQIDGSSYNGLCACLVGTIASLQDCEYRQVPGIPIDESRPAERFFTGIGAGDTPETNPVSAIVLGWIDEFTALPTAQ